MGLHPEHGEAGSRSPHAFGGVGNTKTADTWVEGGLPSA